MTILIRSVILNHWSQKQDYLETKQRWKGSGLSILSKSLSLIPVWHHLAQCPLTLCGRPCHCCHGDVWTCTGLEGRTAWWWGGGYRQQQTTLGRHPEAWAQGKQPSLIPVGLLSRGDTAAVSNPTEDMRWRFSVFAGGQLPDSHKPGTDGVGLIGKGPEEASWTVAERGDCLSAQALGHTATPRWARAPALGFQRDVFGGGDWLSLVFTGSQRLPSTITSNSFLLPLSLPAPQMLLQQLFSFSHGPSHTVLFPPLFTYILEKKGGRLSCCTAPICPMSFHAVDHDAAAWLSGCHKDFGKWAEAFDQASLCTLCLTPMPTIWLQNSHINILG